MRGITKTILPLLSRKTIRMVIIRVNLISQIALALMMFLAAVDVILRYVFNSPILFAQELTEFAMVVCISLGLIFCAIEKGYVSVDIIANKLPKRDQAIFDCFTGLLTIVFFSLTCGAHFYKWILWRATESPPWHFIYRYIVLSVYRFTRSGICFVHFSSFHGIY